MPNPGDAANSPTSPGCDRQGRAGPDGRASPEIEALTSSQRLSPQPPKRCPVTKKDANKAPNGCSG